MRILAIIAGFDWNPFLIVFEPHDTIAMLCEKMENQLESFKMPHHLTGAYSLLYTRPAGLTERDADCIALGHGDPVTVTKYFTPAARLDPSKKGVDYFDTSVDPDTVVTMVAFTWPAESTLLERKKRQRGRILFDEFLAKEREKRMGTSQQPTIGQRPLMQATDAATVWWS